MSVSRREFLKKSIVSTVAVSSVSSLTSNPWAKAFAGQGKQKTKPDNPCIGTSRDNPVDCLILGGGIAGITAAQALSLPGYGSAPKGKPIATIVLEGSGRIGGRISTVRNGLFGGPVEQGAVHLHLPERSVNRIFGGVLPVWKDLKNCKLTCEKVPRFWQGRVFFDGSYDDVVGLYHFKRAVHDVIDITGLKNNEELLNGLKKFESDFRKFIERNNIQQAEAFLMTALLHPTVWNTWPILQEVKSFKGNDISAENFLNDAKDFLGKKKYEGHGKDMASLALSGHLPGRLEELSIKGLQSDLLTEMLMEPDDYRVIEGFDELPRRMAAKLNEELRDSHQVVRLNQIVRKIKYNKDGVEVTVRDLSKFQDYSEAPIAVDRTYYGKTAICTFSVGLIKSGFLTFDPVLSEEKRKALDVIQMGGVSQMHIRFKEKFWHDEVPIVNYPGESRKAGRTYFIPYFNKKNVKPPILIAYLNGVDDIKMRDLSNEEALSRICDDLCKIFDKEKKCDLIKPDLVEGFHRKQWIDDPFALGGFSYLKYLPKSPVPVEKSRRIYAEPDGALFWAGEATVLKEKKLQLQPSSVPGAHYTGLVAAQKVREFLGGKLA